MALDPQYASLAVVGAVTTNASADTSITAPTNVATILTGKVAVAPRAVADMVTNGTTKITSATASFASTDVGQTAAGDGIPQGTTIAGVINSTTAVLSNTATTSVGSQYLALGGYIGGTKVEEVQVAAILSTSAASKLNIFLYNGSTYYFITYIIVAATNVVNTTTGVSTQIVPCTNLNVPSGWSLRVTNTVANGTGATAATHNVFALGEEY